MSGFAVNARSGNIKAFKIETSTPLKDSLAALAEIGFDNDTIKSLSDATDLAKARRARIAKEVEGAIPGDSRTTHGDGDEAAAQTMRDAQALQTKNIGSIFAKHGGAVLPLLQRLSRYTADGSGATSEVNVASGATSGPDGSQGSGT